MNDVHGIRVPNPYQWLEDLDAPEVREWAAAQTSFALPYFRESPLRPWLQTRLSELSDFWSEPSSGDGEEPGAPLIDEGTLEDGEALEGIRASPDGQHAAYTVSNAASHRTEARIRRLADGTDLDERLDGLLGPDLSWTRDGGGFFYVRMLGGEPGTQDSASVRAVSYHVIGTPQAADRVIFRVAPDLPDIRVEQELSDDGRFLFISEGNGAWVDGLGWVNSRLHVLDLGDPSMPSVGGRLVPLSAERDAAHRIVATAGDSLYLFTDRGAPRRRVVVLGMDNPGVEHWRDVVPQTDDVIDQVAEIGDHFVVTYLRNVQHGVRVYDRSGRILRELPFRPMTFVETIREGEPGELVVEATEGLSLSRRRYDVATGRETVERDPDVPSPADGFEMRQVWYPAKDGVQVPMFVMHRRGLVLDGSHPTLMSAYGGSAQVTLPSFSPVVLAVLELGFVLAAPSIRGGGEFGREWYEAATLERKQTTFDDVIAAAEYLIREGYTSAERLAIQGHSNGGWAVAAVITQRPDLFRAAVAGAPATDLLRFDAGTHTTQVGTARNPAHVPFLLAHSPVYNVRPGRCYPATLLTTAFDDDVLPAWSALKMAAALQAAQSCDRPVLVRADPTGGHGGNRTYGLTDLLGFIATQLGVRLPQDPAP